MEVGKSELSSCRHSSNGIILITYKHVIPQSRSHRYVIQHVGELEYTVALEQELYGLDSLVDILNGTKKSFEKKAIIFEGGNRVRLFHTADYEGWVNEIGWDQGNVVGEVKDHGWFMDDTVGYIHYNGWVKDYEGSFGDYGLVWNSGCYE